MKTYIPILILALLTFSCNDAENNQNKEELKALKIELDSLKQLNLNDPMDKNTQIITFLTFQKEDAEQAMNLYIELFDNSEVITLKRWGKEGPGKEGTIMQATFSLNGRQYMCSDSPPIHEWGFTPAVSNFVECEDESQLQRLFTKLSEGGQVMMPIGNYGFSEKFAFVQDQFGVSWQLNLN
ncbi:MAG: VOC family protein [Bacteroidota bacterium]